MKSKPDAVFSSLWGGDLIAFIKQANTYDFFDTTDFISTGAGDLDILKPLGHDMPDDIMATFLYAFDMPMSGKEAQHASFVAKFKEKAGYEPRSGDIIGYISTHMIADAIDRAGTTRSKKLAQTLRGMSFDTVLGEVAIRPFDGQATFGHYTGFTYTHPDYPFKRLKHAVYADGSDVLHSEDEVKKIRAADEKRRP
jgi:branched-chain amino acid transport system substrate-binding protein